jgi:hypothetical protein
MRTKEVAVFWSLLILFCCLVLLTQWITKHVQGIGYLVTGNGQIALYLYFLLIFPGILIHELSHAVSAWLMGVKVRRMSLGIHRKGRGGRIALGSVDIGAAGPFRASLIGLAPFVAGCTAILIIGGRVFGFWLPTPFSFARFWQELQTAYQVPDFGLWVYLVFAIGNAMLPSAADRRAWGTTLVFLLIVGALAYLSGVLNDVPSVRRVSTALGDWLWTAGEQLTYAFTIAVIVDVVVAATLFLLEQALALFGLGRLEYQ